MTGRSAARLARLLWEQEVPGSNPGAPTEKNSVMLFFLFIKTNRPITNAVDSSRQQRDYHADDCQSRVVHW